MDMSGVALVPIINNALAPLSLRLVQADDEYDDRNSYIILLSDRRPNDFLRDAFGLTQTEFALFHLWVNAICSSENGEISKCEALSIASDLLVKDNERATIRLDTRGIAELQNYFNSHADELKLKNALITKSVKTEKVRCPGTLASGESCSAEFHLSVEVESVNENQKDFLTKIVMDFKEVDLETPAGTLADSLAQIFILTTKDELRQQAYQMVDAKNNRDFALAVEARLNEYFESKQRKLDKRSILQIRQEKDGARVILKHFLKSAGLPPDAVEKFSSKNLSTQIKKLERTVNQRNLSRSCLVDMNNVILPGYQGPSNCKRRRLDSFKVGPSIIRDGFPGCDEDNVSNTFLSKVIIIVTELSFQLFLSQKYMSGAETNVENEIGKKKDLKSFHNTTNFDEFSDFSDEFEKESFPKKELVGSCSSIVILNHKTTLSSYDNYNTINVDAEFSSSDDSEFSSINDINFSQSGEELITIFKNVCLDELEYQFHDGLFSKDDTSVWQFSLSPAFGSEVFGSFHKVFSGTVLSSYSDFDFAANNNNSIRNTFRRINSSSK
ncbi:hypothetical protein DINM_022169 [Dirofilaria immitis]|nr:hypothetical protein [Dirofilaria immitis]